MTTQIHPWLELETRECRNKGAERAHRFLLGVKQHLRQRTRGMAQEKKPPLYCSATLHPDSVERLHFQPARGKKP